MTATLAGTPHVRISRDGGRSYPARHARPLPAEPPGQPATIPVYDAGSASGRMLALDLDPGRCLSKFAVTNVPPGGGNVTGECDSRGVEANCLSTGSGGRESTAGFDGSAIDPAAEVERQAEELGQLLEHLGGRYVADVAPSGGRHIYVLLSVALPWLELRDLVKAIALRYPAVDHGPHDGLGGQISPPGARHKSGGWRLLSMPLEDARAAVERPCGPEVWAGLLAEFAAELQQVEVSVRPADTSGAAGSLAELDDTGVPWLPRLGGRARLRPDLEEIARTGRWDRSRYAGRSEARMAVIGALAARGWQLADVQAEIAAGHWDGLARLYERPSEPQRLERLLPAEWRKCIDGTSRKKNVRHRHTSDLNTRPPSRQVGAARKSDTGCTTFLTCADEYSLIRFWLTAILCAAEDPDRVKGWGRRVIAVRLVLLALGQAAMVSGSSTIEFGCRNIALYSCLSHRTVARVLRMLAAEDDPLIDLVSARQMVRADRYALRIPDRYADSVRWRRRRAGRIEAAHPVFLVLGGTSALVYQVLDQAEARGAAVARAARLSASATSAALQLLAEHGLAERGPGGWRRGAADLDDVAESVGAADLQREREARYKQDRESWRARLRQYAGARQVTTSARDGWLSLDDADEYDELSRWPVLSDDFVRGPPSSGARESA